MALFFSFLLSFLLLVLLLAALLDPPSLPGATSEDKLAAEEDAVLMLLRCALLEPKSQLFFSAFSGFSPLTLPLLESLLLVLLSAPELPAALEEVLASRLRLKKLFFVGPLPASSAFALGEDESIEEKVDGKAEASERYFLSARLAFLLSVPP